jgi:hypothetical protein
VTVFIKQLKHHTTCGLTGGVQIELHVGTYVLTYIEVSDQLQTLLNLRYTSDKNLGGPRVCGNGVEDENTAHAWD